MLRCLQISRRFSTQRIMTLDRLEKLNIDSEHKRTQIQDTYIQRYQQHRARRIMREDKINVGEYCGYSEKSFTVKDETTQVEDDSFVILRNRNQLRPFPDFYSLDKMRQPTINKLLLDFKANERKDFKELVDQNRQIDKFVFAKRMPDVFKWLSEKNITGINKSEQISKMLDLNDEAFNKLLSQKKK